MFRFVSLTLAIPTAKNLPPGQLSGSAFQHEKPQSNTELILALRSRVG